MYTNFYNFTESPFEVTSNPKFLYLSRGHKEALASLIYGIQWRKGLLAIVGEVGTGKTTLPNAAIEQLEETTRFAFIHNTDSSFHEQLEVVAEEFKILSPMATISKPKLVGKIKNLPSFRQRTMRMSR